MSNKANLQLFELCGGSMAQVSNTSPGKISCIIPFYNEGERLLRILTELTKIYHNETGPIHELICVDDGSQDPVTAEAIGRDHPAIDLVRSQQNQGKTAAIRQGVRRATGEIILLLDADLEGLRADEIKRALAGFCRTPDIDMLILRRMNAPVLAKLIPGGTTLFSGERILYRQDLETVLAQPVSGWQIESAINEYMSQKGKTVYWIGHSGQNTFKKEKQGMGPGLRNDLQTARDIIAPIGVVRLLRLMFTFAKKHLPGV